MLSWCKRPKRGCFASCKKTPLEQLRSLLRESVLVSAAQGPSENFTMCLSPIFLGNLPWDKTWWLKLRNMWTCEHDLSWWFNLLKDFSIRQPEFCQFMPICSRLFIQCQVTISSSSEYSLVPDEDPHPRFSTLHTHWSAPRSWSRRISNIFIA